MIKKIFTKPVQKISGMKIRTKFVLLIICTGFFCILLFEQLWIHKWPVAMLLTGKNQAYNQLDDTDFMADFCELAAACNIPEDENDKERIAALEPLFNLADNYTSIYIYDGSDGIYRAGRYARIMDNPNSDLIFHYFFDFGYLITDGSGEDVRMFPVTFQNGTAWVTMINYHRALFTYPYLTAVFLLCVLLFLVIILFFINRKMKSVLCLERAILTMSSGDLTSPVPHFGGDEIGILAQELEHLKISLNEIIVKEQESRKANQDLITALSHDLRTPLTILTGYLEVLKLKRNPELQEEYLTRCLKKAADIKELTDRMFEYALVFEENEVPEMTWSSTDFIFQSLKENCDFIKLAGFTPELSMPETSIVLKIDKLMLKRIFTNLFSNILKYGNKQSPVTISGKIQKEYLEITISNTIKQEHADVSSTNIGLKSVEKMMNLLNGKLTVEKFNDSFTILLTFCLKNY